MKIDTTDTIELARLFKALSDPNRLKILQLLRECCPSGCQLTETDESNTVSRLADQFDLSLSTVSHHLKELRIAGLIVCEKRGQTVFCAPNEQVLRTLEAYLKP
jgi:ArsR family transcriptional regulator